MVDRGLRIADCGDKEVAAVEVLQQRRRVTPTGDRLTTGRGQLVEDRGLQQEGPQGRLLALQHLLGQKIKDVARGMRHRLDKSPAAGPVGDAVERAGQQAETGWPTLGAFLQGHQVVRQKSHAQLAVQELGCFVEGETQISQPQLGDLPARAQPRQRQGRVVPRAHDEAHLGWQSLQQVVQRHVDGRLGDQVQVVQDQGKGVGVGRDDVVDQRSDDASCIGARPPFSPQGLS